MEQIKDHLSEVLAKFVKSEHSHHDWLAGQMTDRVQLAMEAAKYLVIRLSNGKNNRLPECRNNMRQMY